MTEQKFTSAIKEVLKDIEEISVDDLYAELMSFKGKDAIAGTLESLKLNYRNLLLSSHTATKYKALCSKSETPIKRCVYEKCKEAKIDTKWEQKCLLTEDVKSGRVRPDFLMSQLPTLMAA